MQKLLKYLMLSIALQGSAFALTSEANISNQEVPEMNMQSENEDVEAGIIIKQRRRSHDHDHRPFNEYASLFLTKGATVTAGDNLIFDTPVLLSGIGYDTSTGVFTLPSGTFSVIYFYTPFTTPPCNLWVNGEEQILNSGIGGGATLLTLIEPINTLEVIAITTGTFSNASANQSLASIAISRIE
jgi:hypothetical protein